MAGGQKCAEPLPPFPRTLKKQRKLANELNLRRNLWLGCLRGKSKANERVLRWPPDQQSRFFKFPLVNKEEFAHYLYEQIVVGLISIPTAFSLIFDYNVLGLRYYIYAKDNREQEFKNTPTNHIINYLQNKIYIFPGTKAFQNVF